MNALVVGISADKPEVQQRFIDKFSLTFPMISDTDKTIIDAYGARAVLGVAATRSTFLIDPDGRIAYVWPKVKVEGHADDVVAKIREIAAANATAGATG
ncbi:MAG: redoxin domain-containing protein [Coriobacteriia bacterium]|nr:redoxin domain-containing protein [Coriobacteriia bacterium]